MIRIRSTLVALAATALLLAPPAAPAASAPDFVPLVQATGKAVVNISTEKKESFSWQRQLPCCLWCACFFLSGLPR